MGCAPDTFAVWTGIPATDPDAAMAFYAAVFQVDLETISMGPNAGAVFPTAGGTGVSGHLYPGSPATDGRGPTEHAAVPDTLEATVERLRAAGGTVLSDPIEIPAGPFVYARAPDGNSIGLFAAAGSPKRPAAGA
ncbi:MAG: VOC family protein [Alphaproteobacteria bacterium]|nr:VOC family protein [Alphaproteobacteria bacterium]